MGKNLNHIKALFFFVILFFGMLGSADDAVTFDCNPPVTPVAEVPKCLSNYSKAVVADTSQPTKCDSQSPCLLSLNQFPLFSVQDQSVNSAVDDTNHTTDQSIVKPLYQSARESGNCFATEDMQGLVNSCTNSYSSLFDVNDKPRKDGVCAPKQNLGDILAIGSQLVAGTVALLIPAESSLAICGAKLAGAYKSFTDGAKVQSDCKDAYNSCVSSCNASSYQAKFKNEVKSITDKFPAFDPNAQNDYLKGEACVVQLKNRGKNCAAIEANVKAGDSTVATQLQVYSTAFSTCMNAIQSLCGPNVAAGGACAAATQMLASYPKPDSINPSSICAAGSTSCNSNPAAALGGGNAGGSSSAAANSALGNLSGPFGYNGPAEAAHIPVPPADKSAAAGLALGTGSSGGGPFGGGNGGGNPGAKAAAQQGGGAAPPTPAAKLGFIGSSSSTSSSAGSGYNSTTAAAKNGERAVFGSKIAGARSPTSESLANVEGDVFYHASKQYYNEALAKRVYSDGTVSGP